MHYYNIDIRLEGEKFCPSKLQSRLSIPMTVLSEYGIVAEKGRYAGHPAPYGMAVFQFHSLSGEINSSLQECYSKLLSWKRYFDEYGVEDIIVDIGSFDEHPLDVTFSKELLNSFNLLNATIEFHTIAKDRNLERSKKTVKLILNYFNKESDYDLIWAKLSQHNFIFDDVAVSTFLYFYYTTNNSRSFEQDINSIESITSKLQLERA